MRVNVCPRSDAHYGIEDGMFAMQSAQRHGISPGLSVDNETSYSGGMYECCLLPATCWPLLCSATGALRISQTNFVLRHAG